MRALGGPCAQIMLLAAARSTFRGGGKSYKEAPRRLQGGRMGEKVLLAAARSTFSLRSEKLQGLPCRAHVLKTISFIVFCGHSQGP